jgi:hypothetical protein
MKKEPPRNRTGIDSFACTRGDREASPHRRIESVKLLK